MFNWLKKHFIPYEANEYRPHILRNKSLRNVAILVITLEFFIFLLPTLTYVSRISSSGIAAVLPGILSSLTNEERGAKNISPLSENALLTKAAELKAKDMAEKGYFAHTSPEGRTPWYWLEQVGYEYQYAGENLAVNFRDSKDVTDAWMKSPSHRDNIVKSQYTEVGTGIATGIYKNKKAVFVAQLYANPAPIIPVVLPQKIKVPDPSSVEDKKQITKIDDKQTSVLGAEILSETFLDTKTIVEKNTDSTPVYTGKNNYPKPNMLQRILSSPRHMSDKIFIVIMTVMVIALLLNIFIKIEHHHPDLVTNGLIVIALIGFFFTANNYISQRNLAITDGFDYSINLTS